MEQFKRAQVIILSTQDNNSQLAINLGVGEFIGQKIPKGDLCISSSKGWSNAFRPQHLYIISDDEIKEGDWVIDSGGIIRKVDRINEEGRLHLSDLFALTIHPKSCKKIISTTDTSLTIDCIQECKLTTNIHYSKLLPQPSQQFIEKYIEEYNKGNIIKDVLVEYELIPFSKNAPNRERGSRLKINSKDNTITIKKLKDSWNREEVENLLYKITEDFSSSSRLTTYFRSKTDNWIKENL